MISNILYSIIHCPFVRFEVRCHHYTNGISNKYHKRMRKTNRIFQEGFTKNHYTLFVSVKTAEKLGDLFIVHFHNK